MKTKPILFILAVGAAMLSGCAESTTLITEPPGARVSINERFVGTSPVEYKVPRSEWEPPYRYRIERDGYVPIEGDLPVGPTFGRIFVAVMTYGISLIFHRPSTFIEDEFHFTLTPTSTVASGNSAALAAHASAVCTTAQILSMKNSGVSDGQIKAACE